MKTNHDQDLESLELKISKFLRYGVITAGIFLFIGWMSSFSVTENPFTFFKVYDPIPLQDILQVYLRNKSWGTLICYVGLIILISLPLIRVVLTAVLFIKQREYHLALIASLVLTGLIVSFCFGIEL